MAKSKNKVTLPPLTADEATALCSKLDGISLEYTGDIGELESAIGMMFVVRLFGWRVVALVHNKRTIRKYEKLLGISIKDFEEEGPLARKSVGLSVIKTAADFWKAVSGDLKVPGKREIQS